VAVGLIDACPGVVTARTPPCRSIIIIIIIITIIITIITIIITIITIMIIIYSLTLGAIRTKELR